MYEAGKKIYLLVRVIEFTIAMCRAWKRWGMLWQIKLMLSPTSKRREGISITKDYQEK